MQNYRRVVNEKGESRRSIRYVKSILSDENKLSPNFSEILFELGFQRQELTNDYLNCLSNQALTVNDIMNKWLIEKKNRIKISTFQKYGSIISNHISNSIGKYHPKELSAETISWFIDNLLLKGLSKKTINLILIVLNMGLSYAKKQYGVSIPEIQPIKIEKNTMRVFSETEQQVLVRYLLNQSNVFSLGILIALYTGMRIGEICALEWKNVTEGTICVRSTMQRLKSSDGKTDIMILSPKSEASNRIIPIPVSLLPLIEQNRKKSGFVLAPKDNKYTEPRLLQIKFAKYLQECGIEKANFHTLRHTFATRCIESGVDVKTLSELLGHSDVKTTLSKYVHSSFELKQKSINKLLFNY